MWCRSPLSRSSQLAHRRDLVPCIFRMQKHRQRAGAIKSLLHGIRRGSTAGPFQDQRCRQMRNGSFRREIREGPQGYLLCGELLSEGAVELDEAVHVVMHHDAHSGHG